MKRKKYLIVILLVFVSGLGLCSCGNGDGDVNVGDEHLFLQNPYDAANELSNEMEFSEKIVYVPQDSNIEPYVGQAQEGSDFLYTEYASNSGDYYTRLERETSSDVPNIQLVHQKGNRNSIYNFGIGRDTAVFDVYFYTINIEGKEYVIVEMYKESHMKEAENYIITEELYILDFTRDIGEWEVGYVSQTGNYRAGICTGYEVLSEFKGKEDVIEASQIDFKAIAKKQKAICKVIDDYGLQGRIKESDTTFVLNPICAIHVNVMNENSGENAVWILDGKIKYVEKRTNQNEIVADFGDKIVGTWMWNDESITFSDGSLTTEGSYCGDVRLSRPGEYASGRYTIYQDMTMELVVGGEHAFEEAVKVTITDDIMNWEVVDNTRVIELHRVEK